MAADIKINFYFYYSVIVIVFYVDLINTGLSMAESTDSTIAVQIMSEKERKELKEETREMFYHAYRSYMDNAYPADELMPLSCKGRYRGITPSRGDIDDVLGNFSMTLIDTLDTLVILGDFKEFENAVKLVIKDVQFDNDIVVSVFETNIRMIGGLISAHILAEYLQKHVKLMSWYRGELLEMAKDLGYRLLPAFNTSTGIPHGRVNLKYGMKDASLERSRETCTACAGTMLLEFAALSRLTGDPIFERKAHTVMDALWKLRHRNTDLMGTVLNIHSGDWVRRDSGIGAGIDSYYEYLLKSYILLGEDRYLLRFNRHYNAVMKYVNEGPMFLDVLMHRPHAKTKNFMDALLAFWPGLQVLSGDLKPAVQTHEMLYQVMQMHNFIPEAFTVDFQIHWGQHHLRPEFIESTYYLFKATNDHYYLQVGKEAVRALQKYAKVPCGYAAVNDVRTGKHEDRMDSFVLSETLKYLYLLFSESNDLIIDLDEYIFTTEAHLLPLSLGHLSNNGNLTMQFFRDGTSMIDVDYEDEFHAFDFTRTCASPNKLFPEKVRRPMRNYVSELCPRPPSTTASSSRLRAWDFKAHNADHLRAVYDMGITMVTLGDGKIRLLHSFHNAKTPEDAELGILFMQEMLDLNKSNTLEHLTRLQVIYYKKPLNENGNNSNDENLITNDEKINDKTSNELTILIAGPSHFSLELSGENFIESEVAIANTLTLCTSSLNDKNIDYDNNIKSKIALAQRGDCTFIEKARNAEKYEAIALIICDNIPGTSIENLPMFAMSGDGKNDVKIPVVFIYSNECKTLTNDLKTYPQLKITIMQLSEFEKRQKIFINSKLKNV